MINMKIKKIIEDKDIVIYYKDNSSNNIPVIILNTFNEDGEEIWDKVSKLRDKECIIVSISNIDWNKEMSPWYMEKLFKGDSDYLGGADKYLNTLTKIIIPNISKIIEEELNKNISKYILAGYSLAGLFAVYSLYKTNIFSSIISCSGSLWYPKFIEYIEENDLKVIPDKIYLSLGNKESNTKNKLMSQVYDKTKYIEEYFRNKNIKVIFEENEGNHFQDVTLRIARGIVWILERES